MSASSSLLSLRRRPVFQIAVLALFSAVVGAMPVLAQGTHLWTQSKFEEFEKGTQQGVSIESDGHLHQGPGLKDVLTTLSTFVWSSRSTRRALPTSAPAPQPPCCVSAKMESHSPCLNRKT